MLRVTYVRFFEDRTLHALHTLHTFTPSTPSHLHTPTPSHPPRLHTSTPPRPPRLHTSTPSHPQVCFFEELFVFQLRFVNWRGIGLRASDAPKKKNRAEVSQ